MDTITIFEAEKLLKTKRLSEVRRCFDIKTLSFPSTSEETKSLLTDYCMTNYEFCKINKFSAEQCCTLFKLMNAILIYITEYEKSSEDVLEELEEFICTDSRRCEWVIKSYEKWASKIIFHVSEHC